MEGLAATSSPEAVTVNDDPNLEQPSNSSKLVTVAIDANNYLPSKHTAAKRLEFHVPDFVQLQEIRAYLLDSEAWYLTRFAFSHRGVRVADDTPLHALVGSEARATLQLVPVPYDSQSAVFHVRNLVKRIFPVANSSSPSLFYAIAGGRDDGGEEKKKKKENAPQKKRKNKGKGAPAAAAAVAAAAPEAEADAAAVAAKRSVSLEQEIRDESPPLELYYPPVPAGDEDVLCLRSLSFSSFNPPPASRRYQGDLFYLDVLTMENKFVVVTVAEKGFFVNSSTRTAFDAAPVGGGGVRALLSDLMAELSQQFRANFALFNRRLPLLDTVETLPLAGGPPPWVGKGAVGDSGPRPALAQEELLRLHGVTQPPGQARDWNEEYQTLYAQTTREREGEYRVSTLGNFFRVHAEFVEASQRGAVGVVDGTVSPLNPMDPPESQMWLFDGIFYSMACNIQGMFDGLGGAVAAHKNAGHSITALRMLRSAGVPKMFCVAECVVDYRGRRVVCQSVVPGLLSHPEGDETTGGGARPPAFGPSDDLGSYARQAEFEAFTAELSRRLGLRSSQARFGDATVAVNGPVEMRGLVGGDRRCYVMEAFRLLPRDLNFPEREQSYYLLRPELLAAFREQLSLKALQNFKVRALAKEEERKKGEEEKKEGKEEEKTAEKTAAEAEAEAAAKGPDENVIYIPDSSVNVNVGVHDDRMVYEQPEERERDANLLKTMAQFLVNAVVPAVVEAAARESLTSDLSMLPMLLHERGINMRYLGQIAELAAVRAPLLAALCVEEMVVRAVKHLVRAELREVSVGRSAGVVVGALNRLLGCKHRGKGAFAHDLPFWHLVRGEVQTRFRFPLNVDGKLSEAINKRRVLRGVCLALGVTIEARSYNMESSDPFQPDDVLAFHPLVRHAPPEVRELGELVHRGHELIQDPATTALGIVELEQAIQAVYHIMGPHTALTSAAHQLLAAAYAGTDPLMALQHQERAVLILERLRGLDHEVTVRHYVSLSTLYLENKLPERALAFVRRALYLVRVTDGGNAAYAPVCLSQLAAILREMGDMGGATYALRATLELYERQRNEVMATHTCRSLATCYQAAGFYKQALEYEKRYNRTISRFYSADDPKLVDSNEMLSVLTAQAVNEARERVKAAKAAQAPAAAAAAQSRPKMARNPMSVLPKPGGAGAQPLSRVLSMMGSKKK